MKKASLALIALFALTGCTTAQAMEANELACDEFAAYSKDGMPKDQRSEVVSSIGEIIGNADPQLQDAHDGLVNSVDKPESTWTLAADSFAQTCFDLGWEG